MAAILEILGDVTRDTPVFVHSMVLLILFLFKMAFNVFLKGLSSIVIVIDSKGKIILFRKQLV